MILEGIVTTVDSEGRLNIAPMGPRITPGLDMDRFVLRPYRTSTTYRNIKATGQGVFHVTDDVLLLAHTAIGAPLKPAPALKPAEAILGWILADACRYYEFRAISIEDSFERTTIEVETVTRGRHRDFLGFNRARNAVLEAAILATRVDILPCEEISAEYRKLAVIIEKTGGPSEHEAFRLLCDHVRRASDPPNLSAIDSTPS